MIPLTQFHVFLFMLQGINCYTWYIVNVFTFMYTTYQRASPLLIVEFLHLLKLKDRWMDFTSHTDILNFGPDA